MTIRPFVQGLLWVSLLASVARADLIRHWPFDGTFEELVSGDDGTPVGSPVFSEDRGGTPDGAVSIDGALQQSVNVPGGGGLDDLQEGTIALFVKWVGFQDSACCNSSGNATARQSNGVFSNQVIGLSGPDPSSATVTWQPYSAGAPAIVGGMIVGDGEWHHIAVTWTNGDHKLYIDGVLDGSSAATGAMNSNPAVDLSIGAWIGDGGGYSTSMIDDLKVFDAILTEDEIQDLLLPPTPIVLSERVFTTGISEGDLVATLTTPGGDEGDTFTYALVGGEGDADNGKFQISGDQLQAAAFDFSGLADGSELSIRVESTGAPSGAVVEAVLTLTASADSDADGLPDEYELQWADDLTALSGLADADADGDGLTDLEEFNLRDEYPELDPTESDSDGDSLGDKDELDGAGERPVTDPTNPDSDEDGLNDGVESNTGTFAGAADSGTDPTAIDTDGDGTDDASEVAAGTDPTNANDFPPVQLVGLWRFEGNADDSSGLENHGTFENGASLSDDTPDVLGGGQSLSVDGTTQHVLVPDHPSLDLDQEITLTAWIKPADTSWGGIIAKNPQEGSNPNHAGNYELRLNQNNMNPSWLFEAGPANSTLTLNDTSTSVPVDEWTHLALTMDKDSSYTFYVNGTPTTTATAPNPFGVSVNDNPLYIGSRADLFTTFNGNLDDVAVFDGVLGEAQIQSAMDGDFSVFGVSGSQLQLDIKSVPVGDELVIKWASQFGKLYNLRSTTDLEGGGDPATWPIYNEQMDIEATPDLNTLVIPLPPEATRFFVIEEFPKPPTAFFFDDFESGQGAWTVGSDGDAGTAWELGAPAGGVSGPPSANSGAACFGTNLAGEYAINANVWLRSPALDLTDVAGATLHFSEFKDIEAGFDFGVINILDATDNSLIEELSGGIDGVSVDWENATESLPAAAMGKMIKIEFRLTSDELENFAGWYIDDVLLTVP